ncbi:MAG: hypothetical protein JRN33_06755 [Nitrososphaerota archaeon]|nr:hypothetical protein [Nitrososphaerota archaeon]
MTTFDIVLPVVLGVAAFSAVVVVDAWRSKKRMGAAEEYGRERRREQEEWDRREEAEEKRWEELAAKHGVSTEEIKYQSESGLTIWDGEEQKHDLTPGRVGVVGLVRRYTGQDASKGPYTVTEVRFKWVGEAEQIERKENANVFTAVRMAR